LPGSLREALRRPGRRGLVTGVDYLDPLGLAAVVDREQVAAGEAEEVADAARGEGFRNQPAAMARPAGVGGLLRLLGAPLRRRHFAARLLAGPSTGRQATQPISGSP